jgi:hypothetical protein
MVFGNDASILHDAVYVFASFVTRCILGWKRW